MKVTILGDEADSFLLGGLLQEQGHEVFFSHPTRKPEALKRGGLRLQLPDRWLNIDSVRLVDQAADSCDFLFVTLRPEECSLISQEYLSTWHAQQIVFVDWDPQTVRTFDFDADVQICTALPLWTAVMLQPGNVELPPCPRQLYLEKNRGVKKLLNPLKKYGFSVQETDNPLEVYHALLIRRLVDLPAALCHTTTNDFLKAPAGKKIAQKVLQEGLHVLRRSGRSMAKIPMWDPDRIVKPPRDEPVQECQLPDRSYNPVLQALIRERETRANATAVLLHWAAAAGVDTPFNRRLVDKLPRMAKVGFYRSSEALYEAVK